MKKRILILLTIIAVLVTSVLPVAFADGSLTPQFSMIDAKDYIEFSPEKIAVNDAYIVYTKGNALTALSRADNSKLVLNTEGYTGIESIAVKQSFLYCVLRDDDNAILRVYDLTNGNYYDSAIVGLSVSIYGNTLFVYYGTGYNVYDLSNVTAINDEPELSRNLTKPFDSSSLFAANSQSVFAVKNNTVNDIKLNDEKKSFTLPFYPVAVTADDNYIYFMTMTELRVYSVSDYTEVYSIGSNQTLNTSSVFLSLSVNASKLYVSYDSLADGIAVFAINDGGILQREKTLTTAGATVERLYNPSSVSSDGENIAIADTGNNRILMSDGTQIQGLGVYKVALNSTDVFFADSEGLKLYSIPGGFVATLVASVTVKSLKSFSDGALYATDTGVYVYSNSAPSLIKEGSYTAACSSFNGKILYIADNENVIAVYKDTAATLFTVPFSSLNISGQILNFECDAHGNLIVMTKDNDSYKLTHLKRTLNGYQYTDSVVLDGIIPTDFTVGSNGIYFTSTDPQTLTFLPFDELTARGIVYTATFTSAYAIPDYSVSAPLTEEAKIYKITNGDYNSFESPDSYESATSSTTGVQVYSVDNKEYTYDGNTFCFVICNGVGKFMLKSSLSELSPDMPATKYGSALFANTVVYKYPDADSVKITTVNKGTRIETISDVCGFNDSLWYSISLNGYVGYVKRADIATTRNGSDVPPDDSADTEKYYAEVCYDNTMIYAFADESSSILGILKAGDTVELAGPYNKDDLYTFVTFGETSGYVLTSSLKVPGLSVAQVVALVIIFSAAIIIIILRILSKKAARKKNN